MLLSGKVYIGVENVKHVGVKKIDLFNRMLIGEVQPLVALFNGSVFRKAHKHKISVFTLVILVPFLGILIVVGDNSEILVG